MDIIFLGTGTSHGVPFLCCSCPVCSQAKTPSSKNWRTRSSLFVQTKKVNILIDASQDFRTQMLRHNICKIDCVLFTHEHADHIFGLPDIRSYTRDKTIPCYSYPGAVEYLVQTFDYCFNPRQVGGGIPSITIEAKTRPFDVKHIHIIPIPVKHGVLNIYGYRIENMAYIPDVSEIPASSLTLLDNLDILVIDALKYKPHPTHLSVDESLSLIEQINPKKAFLTHISHDIDHYNCTLPDNVKLAYDGLKISL